MALCSARWGRFVRCSKRSRATSMPRPCTGARPWRWRGSWARSSVCWMASRHASRSVLMTRARTWRCTTPTRSTPWRARSVSNRPRRSASSTRPLVWKACPSSMPRCGPATLSARAAQLIAAAASHNPAATDELIATARDGLDPLKDACVAARAGGRGPAGASEAPASAAVISDVDRHRRDDGGALRSHARRSAGRSRPSSTRVCSRSSGRGAPVGSMSRTTPMPPTCSRTRSCIPKRCRRQKSPRTW